jgi:Cu(I)/Ag(I) efflux system membrane protein CusA/SilA
MAASFSSGEQGASFIPMYYLNVSSNVMSLGGWSLAIGVLIDAAIVMVENGY